ncbi:MAG: pyridoxamine 5'-phosphate oxidase family protein [Gammaproteobacteria bacterium]|nr:pyridoxamine 5'-phosphate oxidase family protein [Gammaproteobacteria bacterium]MBU1416590.1 pyridoxamine 5'-phosphate oxidase family protein [Gammaproteobacteria bacterium]
MESRLDILIDLLHACPDGALATHSVAVPGFPFATALPFATDQQHRPVFLISTLAEHTQNLAADSRASLLVRRLLPEGEMSRATLAGRVEPIKAEPPLVERYLRYQPEAERFLQFGDFGFFRLEPEKIRIVGGFGQAGWLEGHRLGVSPRLTFSEERVVLESLLVPVGVALLGLDSLGVDLRIGDARRRIAFERGPLAANEVVGAAQSLLDSLAD